MAEDFLLLFFRTFLKILFLAAGFFSLAIFFSPSSFLGLHVNSFGQRILFKTNLIHSPSLGVKPAHVKLKAVTAAGTGGCLDISGPFVSLSQPLQAWPCRAVQEQ